jgi:arabinan endo-1,5-alpha-L-arabinosidase
MAPASRLVGRLLSVVALLLTGMLAPSPAAAKSSSYENPLQAIIPGDGVVESCADPSVIRGQTPSDPYWYAYCTTDPLNDEDRQASGKPIFRFIPILRSLDLVHWTYVGDAFTSRPAWAAAGLWAPNIEFFNGLYYLYYATRDTILNPDRDSGIGVATSPSPTGPFVDSGGPIIGPRPAPQGKWYATIDPDVTEVGGQKYIFFGGYFGGIWARRLTPDGFYSDPASETQITIGRRYEGPGVVYKSGYYYLFASATNCCNGPLTGYSVFVGRSRNVLGPYVDREGVSLLAGRVGGTPFLSMNGNAFVGPGHNCMIQDFQGQWWTFYHAVNRFDPYFEVDFPSPLTKRPLMLDPVDWIGGWPTVRGGYWVSDDAQPGPAAQPGDKTNYRTPKFKDIRLGKLIPGLSDEFNLPMFTAPWTWIRPPAPETYVLTGTTLRWETQDADLHEDRNNASVLTEPAPKGDYAVEMRLHLNLPPVGCCFNFVQAGSVAYASDDNFIRLSHVSIEETRQTAFAKEWFPVPADYPRYGNTVVGPPGRWTSLRMVRCESQGEETYTPYTRRDGASWVRGGTWTHELGDAVKIGLVSLGGSGFVADFDYVRVYRVHGCSQPVDSPSGED